MGKFSEKLGKFFKVLFLVIIIALIIKAFAIDAFRIPSTSMENTLQPGDFILTNKFAYNIATPREIPLVNVSIPQYKFFTVGKPQINDIGFTTPPKAMPDECKLESVVESYRNYYIKEKKSFAKWKNRNTPKWFLV